MNDLFGQGNYYIELQDHGLEEDTTVLPQLIRLSRETGIPMVATNDCPLHHAARTPRCRAFCCASRPAKPSTMSDRMEFQTEEFYVKSTDEMYDLFSDGAGSHARTPTKLQSSATLTLSLAIPSSRISKLRTAWTTRNYFEKLCYEGLARRYPGKVPDALRDTPGIRDWRG